MRTFFACEGTKLAFIWATAFCLSALGIAWAIAFSSVYAPVRPQRDALTVCAENYDIVRQNGPFCLSLAKAGR